MLQAGTAWHGAVPVGGGGDSSARVSCRINNVQCALLLGGRAAAQNLRPRFALVFIRLFKQRVSRFRAWAGSEQRGQLASLNSSRRMGHGRTWRGFFVFAFYEGLE